MDSLRHQYQPLLYLQVMEEGKREEKGERERERARERGRGKERLEHAYCVHYFVLHCCYFICLLLQVGTIVTGQSHVTMAGLLRLRQFRRI